MSRPTPGSLALVACAGLVVAAIGARQLARAQTADRLTTGERVYEPGQYLGPITCDGSKCHGKAAPSTERSVLQNEYTTWLDKDLHRRAQETLGNEDSATIVRNLGIAGAATEAAECLACHSLVVPPDRQANRINPADGVSCEACHGPAGGWLEEHQSRGWSHERSVERGMLDMRSIGTRTETCLGCHLGDGVKEVDHRLVAAGHPELVFELDNFATFMPPHWDPFKAIKGQGGRPATHGARAWALGQVHGLRYDLEQLARRAERGPWPEFTEMDCDACHHSLERGRWRTSGYRFHGGLPSWSPARWVMTRIVVEKLAPAELAELDKHVGRVALAVSSLGPPAEARAAARDAIVVLDRIAPRLDGVRLGEQELIGLLRAVLAAGERIDRADRQSAQQAALALSSLAFQLDNTSPGSLSEAFLDGVDRLLEPFEGLYEYDRPEMSKELEALRKSAPR